MYHLIRLAFFYIENSIAIDASKSCACISGLKAARLTGTSGRAPQGGQGPMYPFPVKIGEYWHELHSAQMATPSFCALWPRGQGPFYLTVVSHHKTPHSTLRPRSLYGQQSPSCYSSVLTVIQTARTKYSSTFPNILYTHSITIKQVR